MKHKNIAIVLTNKLCKAGVTCYIYHGTYGNVYVRFEDFRMGSIRIADHNGREQYNYKFNIRSDFKPKQSGWKITKTKDGRGIWRYYTSKKGWIRIIPIIVNRHKLIQTWASDKYGGYKTPDFKKKQHE